MIITERTKRAIPFTPDYAKRVGAGSLLTDDLHACTVAAGSPAKPIRSRR